MRVLPFLAILAAAALAGCFGHPEGTARVGDVLVVQARAEAVDDGAEVLDMPIPSFRLGSGDSFLGPDVERALQGTEVNDTVRLRLVPHGPGEEHLLPQHFDTRDAQPVVPVAELARDIGAPEEAIEPGLELRGGQYSVQVVSVEGGDATLQYVLRDDGGGAQRDPAPGFGVIVVGSIEDGTLEIRLEPEVGAIVRVDERFPLPGLEPGFYRMTGTRDGSITMVHGTSLANVLAEPVDLDVQVLQIEGPERDPYGNPVDVGSPHYGSRQSPVVGSSSG